MACIDCDNSSITDIPSGPPGPQGPTGPTGPAPIISGTSTSNNSVGTGTKTFNTQTGIAWVVGERLRAISTDLTKIMDGEVTSYNTGLGALNLDVDYTEGTGSASNWNIMIVGTVGPQGATGATGATGPQGPPNVITEITIASGAINSPKDFNFIGSSVGTRIVYYGFLLVEADDTMDITITPKVAGVLRTARAVKQTAGPVSTGTTYTTVFISGIETIVAGQPFVFNVALSDYTQNAIASGRFNFNYQ